MIPASRVPFLFPFSLNAPEESGLTATSPLSFCWLRGEPVINLALLEMISIYSLCSILGTYIEDKAVASLPVCDQIAEWLCLALLSRGTYCMSDIHDGAYKFIWQIEEMFPRKALRGNIN